MVHDPPFERQRRRHWLGAILVCLAWVGGTACAGGARAEAPGIEPPPRDADGWPTWMRDDARSGISPESLELPLDLRWVYRTAQPPQPAWPPPARQDFWNRRDQLEPRVVFDRAYHLVSVDGRVYFGTSSDDRIVCLDARTGEFLWSFFAEAPIRLAPTLHGGRVYFGSDDGRVYCLDGASGRLLWQFDAAPRDRRIVGNGRIISAWPVRSGTLVVDGAVRFACGLFPAQGTWQFALDATTGELLARGETNISAQGYLERRGDRLFVAAGRAPHQSLDTLRRRGAEPGEPLGGVPAGFPYAAIGAGPLRFGGGDGKVAAFHAEDGRMVWSAEVEGRAWSLAVAGGRLFVSTDQGRISCFAPASDGVEETPAAGSRSANDAPAGGAPRQPRLRVEPADERDGRLLFPDAASRERAAALAEQILAETGIRQGYCLVLGAGRGGLACELALRSELHVVGIEPDEEQVSHGRRALQRLGLYGTRVVLHHGPLDKLPYSDALINLVISDFWAAGRPPSTPASEIARVTRPAGGAVWLGGPRGQAAKRDLQAAEEVRSWFADRPGEWAAASSDGAWVSARRLPLAGSGEWTHLYADAANTACSGDRLVGSNLAVQWFGPPGPRDLIDRHHRTVPPLYQDGRLIVPGDNRVYCVDAYNGFLYWEREVPGSRRVAVLRDCGSMALAKGALYLAVGAECQALDVAAGEVLRRIHVPQGAPGDRHWGYVAAVDGLLFGSTTRPGASRSELSRAAIEEGAYADFRPVVTSDGIFCIDPERSDAESGAVLWHYRARTGAILNPTITIGGGRVYFVESAAAETLEGSGRATLADLVGRGSTLAALDLRSGEVAWRAEVDFSAAQHQLSLSYAQEMLIAVRSRNQDSGRVDDEGRAIVEVWYDVHAIDASSGKPTWRQSQNSRRRAGGDHGEQDQRAVIVGDRLYVEPLAYELGSGERLPDWNLVRGGHGCGATSASALALYFRADNPTVCDLATGQMRKVNHVTRPGCWISILPAGGLLLLPEASSGCTCDFPLQTSMGYLPVAEGEP